MRCGMSLNACAHSLASTLAVSRPWQRHGARTKHIKYRVSDGYFVRQSKVRIRN